MLCFINALNSFWSVGLKVMRSGFFIFETNLFDFTDALQSSLLIELFKLELEFEPLRADSC